MRTILFEISQLAFNQMVKEGKKAVYLESKGNLAESRDIFVHPGGKNSLLST